MMAITTEHVQQLAYVSADVLAGVLQQLRPVIATIVFDICH